MTDDRTTQPDRVLAELEDRRTHRETAAQIRHMRRQLADVRHNMTAMDSKIAAAITAIYAAIGDGYPTRGESSRSAGVSDPVSAAIARNDPVLNAYTDLRIAWVTFTESSATVTERLNTVISKATRNGPQAAQRPQTCTAAAHMTGYESWGRKDHNGNLFACPDLIEPDRDSLCQRCYDARARWRKAQRAGKTYQRRAG